jgi:DNA-binding transcriptional ArsR family regulator
MNGYQRLALVTKALAHPIRIQILEALHHEGDACVCHLEALLGYRQAYISQQLSRLREAGLVIDRREGMNVFYSLADDSVLALLDLTREIAIAQAGKEGIQLRFRNLDRARLVSCRCPKCLEKQGITINR